MRRFLVLPVVALAVLAVLMAPASPAAADQVRFRVDSQISLGMVDDEGLLEDEHCGFGGSTTQELLPSDGTVQLGTGLPQHDYAWNRGPFRHRGNAVLFFCGDEVSVCFHPSRASVSAGGILTITMLVQLFEGDGPIVPVLPCFKDDLEVSRTVTLTVPAGTRGCLGAVVKLEDSGGDRVTIGSFCASATPVGIAPDPPPPPPTISALFCESLDAELFCDVTHSGGTPPVTIHWHLNGVRVAALDNLDSISRTCVVGNHVPVRVVVSDAVGRTVERSASVLCRGTGQ